MQIIYLKGVRTQQMQRNNAKMEKASDKAVKYSKFSSLGEMKKEYTEEAPVYDSGVIDHSEVLESATLKSKKYNNLFDERICFERNIFRFI